MTLERKPIRHEYECSRGALPTSSHRYDLRNTPSSDGYEFSNTEDDDSISVEDFEEDANALPNQGFSYDASALQQPSKHVDFGKSCLSKPSEELKKVSGEKQQSSFEHQLRLLLGFLGFLIVVLSIVMYKYMSEVDKDRNRPNHVDEQWLRQNLIDNMRLIRDDFPSQVKSIWPDFLSGITKVLLEKPTEPSIFLLIHQDTKTTACLARKIGRVAHDVLDASQPDPLVVDGAALGRNATLLEDYGLLASTYGPLVEQHRIMILDDLQSVPATVARGLHAFCDTVTPLVKKAVYIFTLNVGNAEGSPIRVAERELNAAWGQLGTDLLSPLVVRLTGGSVFRIRSEEDVTNVC